MKYFKQATVWVCDNWHGVVEKTSQDLDLGPAFIANKLCELPRSVASPDLNLFICEGRILSGLPPAWGMGITEGNRIA